MSRISYARSLYLVFSGPLLLLLLACLLLPMDLFFPLTCDISVRVECPWLRRKGLWYCFSYMNVFVTWQICLWSSRATHSVTHLDFLLAESQKNSVPFTHGNSVRMVVWRQKAAKVWYSHMWIPSGWESHWFWWIFFTHDMILSFNFF